MVIGRTLADERGKGRKRKPGRSSGESCRLDAMFLRDLAFVGPDQVAVADDLVAPDIEPVDSMGPREDEPGEKIAYARTPRAEPHVGRRAVRDPDIVRAERRHVGVR